MTMDAAPQDHDPDGYWYYPPMAKISRDDLPTKIRATKNADELIAVLREAVGALDPLTVFPMDDPPYFCRACSRHMNIRWERMTEDDWTLVARCSRPWWVAVLGEHDVAIQDTMTREWRYQ